MRLLKRHSKSMIRFNPRSRTESRETLFRKFSSELSLEEEAKELNRCRAMSLRTDNVRFLELISYDASTNELTTKLISDGQSLYNALWNGTSLSARILGKELDRGVVRSRMREIGAWLRLYHDSSDHAGAFEEVAEHLNEDLERKVATVRQNELVSEYLLTRIETFCRKIGRASCRERV